MLELVRHRFEPYIGLTEEELASCCGYHVAHGRKPKNLCALITRSLLGVDEHSKIAEFEKAGIKPKTIRLKYDGIPKESISFPTFSYMELAQQEFEESDFYDYLHQKYLFVIFRESFEHRGRYQLAEVLFWQMPDKDLLEAKRCYEEMRRRVRAGRADRSVRSTENRCCHVRPHGRNKNDVLPTPYGSFETKKCFWLNARYIGQEIDRVKRADSSSVKKRCAHSLGDDVAKNTIKVAELFAGVGGFRLGLEGYHDPKRPEFDMPAAGPFTTVWANQWEPPGTFTKQFAARCYRARFGEKSVVNEDIHEVLDKYELGEAEIPDVDMVVGGFPCQDYSVAKPLSQAGGIEGKKGVLWWDIYRFLKLKSTPESPVRYVLLENVDRLLKSPASQRGRDFAIILSCLNDLGYSVEWRVVNSAAYGFPQRRKRTYILAYLTGEEWNLDARISQGLMAQAFPIDAPEAKMIQHVKIPADPYIATRDFNKDGKVSPFMDAGVMQDGHVATCKVAEAYEGARRVLGDVLVDESDVPDEFFIEPSQLPKWEYLKGSKSEDRVNKKTGFTYKYSEGSMAFPDALDRPSRTILTGEGGRGASRFKHVIKTEDGRYRRLVPDELDQLQGFPRGWTNTGMTDGQRAFCMGNALVVGVPHAIGKVLASLA